MDFLKIVKRRSFRNEASYIGLNVALAFAFLIVIRSTNSILPAIGLLLLSKWRVLAVRPRYWFANVQGDLVSLIIGISFVVFLYNSNIANPGDFSSLVVQILSTLLYAAWLVLLRPQSKRKYIVAQSGLALFTGISTIYSIGYGWPDFIIVLLVWLVGYSAARHVLNTYDDEPHSVMLSIAWGLIMAEIGWIAYHWTIAYRLPILNNALLPQVSIIALCLGFLSYKTYHAYYHNQKNKLSDIILPLVFTVSIIIVLLLAFNGVSISNI